MFGHSFLLAQMRCSDTVKNVWHTVLGPGYWRNFMEGFGEQVAIFFFFFAREKGEATEREYSQNLIIFSPFSLDFF